MSEGEVGFPSFYIALLSDVFPDRFPPGVNGDDLELALSTLDGKRLALAIWNLNDAPGPRNREILLAWYGIGSEHRDLSQVECREVASKLLERSTVETQEYMTMLVGSVRAYYQIADKAMIRQTRRFVRRVYGYRL